MSEPSPADVAAIALSAARAGLRERGARARKIDPTSNEGRCPHCGDFTPPPAPPSPPPEAA